MNKISWSGTTSAYLSKKREIFIIPSRTISQMYIKVVNPELKQGYVQLNVIKGAYLGDALATV